MTIKQIFDAIWQKKWLVFWTSVLGAFLAFDIAVLQTPMYRADSRILVIQKQVAGQDIYTISKSAQYLSSILKESIYSDSFFNKVIALSEGEVEAQNFPAKIKDRRKKWEDTVNVVITRDLGLMEISVYYPRPEKARQISLAIAEVLSKEHQFYHGADNNVEVKVLDYSTVTDSPIALQLWLISLMGLVIGFLSGSFWVIRKQLGQEKEARPDYSMPLYQLPNESDNPLEEEEERPKSADDLPF